MVKAIKARWVGEEDSILNFTCPRFGPVTEISPKTGKYFSFNCYTSAILYLMLEGLEEETISVSNWMMIIFPDSPTLQGKAR